MQDHTPPGTPETASQGPPPAVPIDAIHALRQKRMRQILYVIGSILALLIAINLAQQRWVNAGPEILTLALLGLAMRLNARGRSLAAARLTELVLLAMLIALALTGQGLFDESLVAFPSLLVLTSLFGTRREIVIAMLAMLATITILYLLDASGILPSRPLMSRLPNRTVALGAIMLATGLFVSMVTSDMNGLMRQLQDEKKALEASNAQITELAFHDSLTRLPNRALANEHLARLLSQARHDQRLVAVLFLDLDNFKTINDSLGHGVGDELLCQVATRLKTNLRGADIAARLSGDEFLLLLGQIEDAQAITTAATRVLEQLAPPFTLQGMPVHVSCSLGVSVYPRDGGEAQTLLKHADLAMYQAKAAGRNTFRFFDESMNANMLEHLHLATGLRHALAEGELQLHYQPQLDLRSGRVIGAEALLRWQHPELGWIPPAKFIPVAESSGMIHELGNWVLNRACQDARAFRAQGLADLRIAVNVSPLQFRRGNIDHEVAMALARADLPASAIELEITESVLVDDNERLGKTLQCLHDMGVRIAIDDFGTGYSNLGYLQRYAVHRLKIDPSFTRSLCASAEAAGIVQAIIEMAHCLHLELVAEGGENEATLAKLLASGCEYGQGFHWSPAIPADQFIAFARQSRSGPPA